MQIAVHYVCSNEGWGVLNSAKEENLAASIFSANARLGLNGREKIKNFWQQNKQNYYATA